MDGKDYRGIDVVAYIQKVPVLDWFMVTKIDKNEMYADLYREAIVIIIGFSFILLMVGAGFLFFYSYRQKNIYKALWNASAEHSTTLQSIGDAVISTDKQGKVQFMNTVAERLTGWTSKEAKGKNLTKVFKIINEETRISVENPVEKVLQEGLVVGLANHTLLISKDGKEISIADSAAPIKDDDGEIIGIVLVFNDQTQAREAQMKVIASEKKYRRLFESAKDGILILDAENGMIKDVNPFLIGILGLSKEQFIEKAIWELGCFKDIVENQERFLELRQQEYFQTEDLPLETADGKQISVEFISNVYSVNSHKVIQCNIRDITERKRSEQTQRVLYNISIAVNETDDINQLINLIREELGTILDTTNFYIALYDQKTDTLSLPFFIDEKDDISSFPAGKTLTYYVVKTEKPLLATNEKIRELEESGEVESFGSPSEIWLGVPLKIGHKVTGVIAVQSYTDKNAYTSADMEILAIMAEQVIVSIERKKAQQDLEIAFEKALESDRLKSAFLANMSHEIRTPMNGILGFAQLLREPNLTFGEQKKFLGIIEKSGARMLNIINDIVSISKIESGQMEISFSETNVNEQIEFVYNFFKPTVEINGIKLIAKNTLPSSEAVIKTDREKIYAILINLVGNATKFTHSGSIEFGYEKKGKYLEFFVKDTGIGIPDEKKEIIFERFRQGSESMTRGYEGAGLGLSISKVYVEMLDGKIWVESELGEGTTFYFTIPYNAEAESKIIPQESSSKIKTDDVNNKLKILIAEDDESSELFLSTAIDKYIQVVFKARNGFEAVEICRRNPDIDLILMDMRMPEMNGNEATVQIREFNKEVVIIAQTAYGLSGDREKAIAAGCNDYISKPIDLSLLKALIKKYFNI